MKTTLHPYPSSWQSTRSFSASTKSARINEEQLAAALKHHGRLIKAVLKEQYLALTDEDLLYVDGGELEFLEHLEKKTGRSRDEICRLILHTGNLSSR